MWETKELISSSQCDLLTVSFSIGWSGWNSLSPRLPPPCRFSFLCSNHWLSVSSNVPGDVQTYQVLLPLLSFWGSLIFLWSSFWTNCLLDLLILWGSFQCLLWLDLSFPVTHVIFFLGLLDVLKWLYITLKQLGKGYWIGNCIIL